MRQVGEYLRGQILGKAGVGNSNHSIGVFQSLIWAVLLLVSTNFMKRFSSIENLVKAKTKVIVMATHEAKSPSIQCKKVI